jgi:hypothetical protein
LFLLFGAEKIEKMRQKLNHFRVCKLCLSSAPQLAASALCDQPPPAHGRFAVVSVPGHRNRNAGAAVERKGTEKRKEKKKQMASSQSDADADAVDAASAGAALSFTDFLERMKDPAAADLVRSIRA